MKSKWEYKKIIDLAIKVGMGPFGSSIKVETFVPEGIPIVSGQHLHGNRLDEEPGFNYISKDHADRLISANVYPGDVIFTHAGNISNVAYIPDVTKYKRYVASQRQFFLRCDKKKLLPEFITYYFKTHEGQYKLKANSSSVGVPSIAQPVSYLKQLEVPVPPLPEQRAIANVLSALDDKIELNRRTNQTLEQLAQALFKHWFIDNPDREGWESASLSTICDTQYGFTSSSSEEKVGPKFLRITDMNKEPWISWDRVPYCRINEKDFEKYKLKTGDLLVSRMADPGKAAIVDVDIDAVFASYLVRLKLHNKELSYYIFYFLTSPEYVEYANGAMSGSVQSGMNARVITGVTLFIPPSHLIKKFNDRIRPIRQKIQFNIDEISTLAELRDTLLPKLMSGQVRVKPIVTTALDANTDERLIEVNDEA